MTTTEALATFDAAIAVAQTAEAAYKALQDLAQASVGAKLFTIMTVDMAADVARRAYTSDPVNYPASGTKPINYGPWFDVVHKQREYFVANTIEANPDAVEKIKGGNLKTVQFLMGQVMKATRGKANPQLVQELIKKQLGV